MRSNATVAPAWKQQCGSTLIEMALVLPVFFLLLIGLFNFANILLGYSSATFAARAAARYASLHSGTSLAPCTTTACVTNIVKPFIISYLPKTLTVATTWSSGSTVGNPVKVSVTIAYTTAIPFSSLKNVSVGSTAQRVITH